MGSPLEMRGPLEATLPDMREIRKYITSMVLTGKDYRTKPKFKRELKREIEYRSNRAVAEIHAIMEIEYPSDDQNDSDYSYYESSTDEDQMEMVYSTREIESGANSESSKNSEETETYEMPSIYDKLTKMENTTDEILKTVEKLTVYGDDLESLINANINDEEIRNEEVDRYFLHLDVAIAKQNTEILRVRDRLMYYMVQMKVDIEGFMEMAKRQNDATSEAVNTLMNKIMEKEE